MEAVFVLGGLAFLLALAVAIGVTRFIQRRRQAGREPRESSGAVINQDSHSRSAENAPIVVADQPETQANDKESVLLDGEVRRTGLRDDQRTADEAAQRAEQLARLAAAHRVRRKAAEAAHRRAEQEAQKLAAAQKEQQRADDARQHAENLARAAEADRINRKAAEEALRRAEAEAQAAAAREGERLAAEEAQLAAAHEAQRVADEDARLAALEETPCDVANEQLKPAEGAPDSQPIGDSATMDVPAPQRRDPRLYRPSPRIAPTPPVSTGASAELTRERAAPIEVRLIFERAGFCSVSLLPRRGNGMPAELLVTGSGDPPPLLELQDDWYEDVFPANLGQLLKEGVEWCGSIPDGRSFRASLSGREIYVLAPHAELRGFVSLPRLILGQQHVVLCTEARMADVRAALRLTGSPDPILLAQDAGTPAGWVAFRGVSPRIPIEPSGVGDILDTLRPLPDVEIALGGGIRIGRQAWLAGFPPSIQLHGDVNAIDSLQIDGVEATRDPENNCIAPGWDSLGDHTVWCISGSRTYSIRDGAEQWEPWDAYQWSLGELGTETTPSRPSICGVLVRPPKTLEPGVLATIIPASNSVLIGAAPGEIEICMPRSDVRAGLCIGYPRFEPIWAIPADAIRCNKRMSRVLLIGPRQTPTKLAQLPISMKLDDRHLISAWSEAILAAARKGLLTGPSRADIADLWKAYKRCAHVLRGRYR